MVGEVAFFARSTPPAGWLKANGAAVSRTTYANLFNAIGTTFGVGDGRTTFNLPDLRGEFVRGLDDGRNVDGGRSLGSHQNDTTKAHYHGVGRGLGNDASFLQGGFNDGELSNEKFFNVPGEGGWGGENHSFDNYKSYTTQIKTTNNNDVSGETRPRNVALLACIKY